MHDFHRDFLQHLHAERALSEAGAIELFEKLVKLYAVDLRASAFKHYTNRASITKAIVDDCVSVLNKELDFFALKVTKAHCAADDQFHYGIVNLSNDEHAQKATSLTPSQVAYFAKVKAAIADGGDGDQGGAIERMQAENLNQGISNLDHAAVTRALDHFLTQGWLNQKPSATDGDQELRLGPRSALQMQYSS